MLLKLKPCPWCGKPPTITTYPKESVLNGIVIACNNDTCAVSPYLDGDFDDFKNKTGVIKAWNNRI
uniref:Putative restriction alleviation protein n=1 Tax=viral metagenome TaxID=1070528 RepID=A0A6M3KU00_9ZZZZ